MFITLITPSGEKQVPIIITENESSSDMEICVEFEGKEFKGYCKNAVLPQAFAQLQKQLPKDVMIKSCLTCRHGNVCPFCSDDEEYFCTKGVDISCKNDVCDWFNRMVYNDMEKYSRSCTDCCDDFQPQSSDYYTYSLYLYYMEQ